MKTINPNLNDLKIKIFADGADVESMLSMSDKTFIKGFTTNPTLMRKAGITDYEKFAKIVLKSITNLPVSLIKRPLPAHQAYLDRTKVLTRI